MRVPLLALLSAALFFGCPSPRDEGLIVNLQTDLRAGVEFDEVVVTIDGGMPRSLDVGVADVFGRPAFIANYIGLPHGEHAVRVALRQGAVERAARVLSIRFRGSYLITAVITRSCVDFPCEAGFSCAGAVCVPSDCVTGTEPSCPPRECVSEGTCPSTTPCARPLCAAGLCLEEPDDSRCGVDEVCVSDRGCVRVQSADAQVSPDAAVCMGELCNGRDDDCDGLVDESACAVAGELCTATQAGGRVYQHCAARLNRERAQSSCLAIGYAMFDVADASEEAIVLPLIRAGDRRAWLGLNDLAAEGDFRWSTGEPVSYSHWAAGEPNNASNEDCAQVDQNTGLWHDVGCENTGNFVCERAVVP